MSSGVGSVGSTDQIEIDGACENNLKDIGLSIPRNRLVVITGLSGSGKSSLAFDTIYQEGQRRYLESLSAYARQFLGRMEKARVDRVDGLSPTLCIDQKTVNRNPRSTVGTITEILDHLRLLILVENALDHFDIHQWHVAPPLRVVSGPTRLAPSAHPGPVLQMQQTRYTF